MKIVFGTIMIIFYVGIGIIILLGLFPFYGSWTWLRWVAGIMFVAYGIWRGYRQFIRTDI